MGVCLYSCLSYPAHKAHLLCSVLLCHLWPVRLQHTFSALSHKQRDFRKITVKRTEYVFRISLRLLSDTSFILRTTQRDILVQMCICCSSRMLINILFSRQIFEKYSYTKFHEYPFSGSRIFPCGQTYGRFSQFLRTRLKIRVLPTERVYGFYMDLLQNPQRLFPSTRLSFVTETECLLRGPNRIIIWNSGSCWSLKS
jgi:hypothetical protein